MGKRKNKNNSRNKAKNNHHSREYDNRKKVAFIDAIKYAAQVNAKAILPTPDIPMQFGYNNHYDIIKDINIFESFPDAYDEDEFWENAEKILSGNYKGKKPHKKEVIAEIEDESKATAKAKDAHDANCEHKRDNNRDHRHAKGENRKCEICYKCRACIKIVGIDGPPIYCAGCIKRIKIVTAQGNGTLLTMDEMECLELITTCGYYSITKKCIGKLEDGDNCPLNPSFGFEDDDRPTCCEKHSLDGMINIIAKYCQFLNCDKIASCGPIGTKLREFCAQHCPNEGYEDIRHKKCDHIDENGNKCTTVANHNFIHHRTGVKCAKHKEPDMIDVRQKCKTPNCRNQRGYGYPNGKPLYCKNCKDELGEDTMIRIYHSCKVCVALKVPLPKRARYGPLFMSAQYCFEHSRFNYTATPYPICDHMGCYEFATCCNDTGNEILDLMRGDWPIRCKGHIMKGDKELIRKECRDCQELDYMFEEQQICATCCNYSRNKQEHYSKKEESVKRELIKNEIQFIHDETVANGKYKYRPDFQIVEGDFTIMLEIDEHQHRAYTSERELLRMRRIQEDCKRPVVFIRYNPDSYRIDGKLQKNKSRVKHLIELIKQLQLQPVEADLIVHYIYYDDCPLDRAIKIIP